MRNHKQFNTIEGKEVCMMPLSMVGAGEENTIQRIGGKEETRKFLETLGFVVGGKVTVVSQTEGNLIVNIRPATRARRWRSGQRSSRRPAGAM